METLRTYLRKTHGHLARKDPYDAAEKTGRSMARHDRFNGEVTGQTRTAEGGWVWGLFVRSVREGESSEKERRSRQHSKKGAASDRR